MSIDKEYIIETCKDKQTMYGIDICMLQTEPCKRALEMERCPKVNLLVESHSEVTE